MVVGLTVGANPHQPNQYSGGRRDKDMPQRMELDKAHRVTDGGLSSPDPVAK